MKHLAWLSSAPKHKAGERESRRAKMDMLDDEPDYGFPDIGELAYLVGYLSEIGEGQQSGGGLVATGWHEIKAWADLTGTDLTPFEATTLRRLSSAYVSQFYKSEGVDCNSPSEPREDYRETVARRLQALFTIIKGGQENE